jgi:ADP-heptose:LPS heptosyltransferase
VTETFSSPRKILFLAASGIGNTILATPLVQKVKALWPEAQLDFLTSRKIFQSPLIHGPIIRNFFDLESGAAKTLLQLNRAHYDLSLTCFPSNRWQFNVVAGLIRAKLRVTHRYEQGNSWIWLMNRSVPADESLHDIEQNLRLLETIEPAARKFPARAPVFFLPSEAASRADDWLKSEKIFDGKKIGIHVGGATPNRGHRWMNQQLGAIKSPDPSALRRDLEEMPADTSFLFFGGPEEDQAISLFTRSLNKEMQARCHHFKGDIWTTAALISRCEFFVSGDTALMHIAATFHIPQKAYFISTNPNRTAPRNPNAKLVIGKNCVSYRYPFTLT